MVTRDLTKNKGPKPKPDHIKDRVRINRNFIYAGDKIAVKLPGKTQFDRKGRFFFKEWDEQQQQAVVITPSGGWRYVSLDCIERIGKARS